MLGFEAFCLPLWLALVSQSEARTESLQLNRDIVPLIVIPNHNGDLTVFFRQPSYVEKDLESAALHDNSNIEGLSNVKSSYLLCGSSM